MQSGKVGKDWAFWRKKTRQKEGERCKKTSLFLTYVDYDVGVMECSLKVDNHRLYHGNGIRFPASVVPKVHFVLFCLFLTSQRKNKDDVKTFKTTLTC